MRPKLSIRKYCVDFCMNGQANEVRFCADPECALYEHRMNKKVENQRLTSCKAIHARCKDCHTEGYIKDCKFPNCQLFPYREGHNPSRKGLGSDGSQFRSK